MREFRDYLVFGELKALCLLYDVKRFVDLLYILFIILFKMEQVSNSELKILKYVWLFKLMIA